MSNLRASLFFPVFRDERSVRTVAEKGLKLLSELCSEYEIIIVDDGSPDRSGEIADELAREHGAIRVIHHEKNLGYGAAVRSGLAASRFEYICLTDGDDEYEVEDLRKLLRLRDRYDLVITFRYKKIYSTSRIFVSWVYNRLLRLLFRMPFRDVSTGLRMVKRSVVDDLGSRVRPAPSSAPRSPSRRCSRVMPSGRWASRRFLARSERALRSAFRTYWRLCPTSFAYIAKYSRTRTISPRIGCGGNSGGAARHSLRSSFLRGGPPPSPADLEGPLRGLFPALRSGDRHGARARLRLRRVHLEHPRRAQNRVRFEPGRGIRASTGCRVPPRRREEPR